MKKLSEYENEEAIELLADLMEPAMTIFANENLRNYVRNTHDNEATMKIKAIQIALKENKKEIVEVLAILNDTPVKKFRCNVLSITKDLLDILNDKGFADFFTSQVQTEAQMSSSDVMENTEEGAQ